MIICIIIIILRLFLLAIIFRDLTIQTKSKLRSFLTTQMESFLTFIVHHVERKVLRNIRDISSSRIPRFSNALRPLS